MCCFLTLWGRYNGPVFHGELELQGCPSATPRSLSSQRPLCLFPARYSGLKGRESYYSPSRLPRPYLNPALGEKLLLSWILIVSSSRSGNLNFHFAGKRWPLPLPETDVTANLAYSTSQCLHAIGIFFPEGGRQCLWGLRVESDQVKGQRWPFLCHQYEQP